MRQSKLFTRTTKEIGKDEVSVNARLLIRAGFIDKLTAGVYTFLPLGLRTLKKIENIVRGEMNAIGGQEILMPALTPKENWEQSGRWDNFDALYRFEGHDGKEYALGATHEEVVTPLAQMFLKSYRDLPAYIYQIQTKFRNEPRAKAGLLRGREFLMKDLYSFHATPEDLDDFYDKMLDVYPKVYDRVGLGESTFPTYALGGSFSKYSHEFQTICESGEDEVYLCKKCELGHNKELIDQDGEVCVGCEGKEFDVRRAIEVGNIFKLQTKFSEPFKLQYMAEDGSDQPVLMGCYGIGISRIMGSVVEIHNDDKGIIWPSSIAPFSVHLVTLGNDAGVNDQAEQLYKRLLDENVEVLYDDRDESAGTKLGDADLIGLPMRVVISQKTKESNAFEVKLRDKGEAQLLNEEALLKYINENI